MITSVQKMTNCIYLEVYFLPQNKNVHSQPPPCLTVVHMSLLEIQFGHRLQEPLLSFLCSQLQHFLWVAGVQLGLSDRFYLKKSEELETDVALKQTPQVRVRIWLKRFRCV